MDVADSHNQVPNEAVKLVYYSLCVTQITDGRRARFAAALWRTFKDALVWSGAAVDMNTICFCTALIWLCTFEIRLYVPVDWAVSQNTGTDWFGLLLVGFWHALCTLTVHSTTQYCTILLLILLCLNLPKGTAKGLIKINKDLYIYIYFGQI